jgi:hypothetical protein
MAAGKLLSQRLHLLGKTRLRRPISPRAIVLATARPTRHSKPFPSDVSQPIFSHCREFSVSFGSFSPKNIFLARNFINRENGEKRA